MRSEVLQLALIVGVCTYAFRYLPLIANLTNLPQHGVLGRFLAATGPAAIATLFVAEILPYLRGATSGASGAASGMELPLLAGVCSVFGIFLWRRSVVAATLGGALVFGLVTAATLA